MLEMGNYNDIIGWSSSGTTFLVKDPNLMTTRVMPLIFKHQNLSSFVRQLNKYDFHKVKSEEGRMLGSQAWEFHHDSFRRGRPDLLASIKRKPIRKNSQHTSSSSHNNNNNNSTSKERTSSNSTSRDDVHDEELDEHQRTVTERSDDTANNSPHMASPTITTTTTTGHDNNNNSASIHMERLLNSQKEMMGRLDALTGTINVMGMEMKTMQTTIQGQDRVIQSLYQQMAELKNVHILHRQQQQQQQQQQISLDESSSSAAGLVAGRDDPLLSAGALASAASTSDLTMFAAPTSSTTPTTSEPTQVASTTQPKGKQPAQTGHTDDKKKTSWAVAPRVLLVEDDPTCRSLSSRLLQIFGCKFDVATDGLAAVNKMNLDRYDIVLMDIVMPNLDGVSATVHIRQFDQLTPIISMTSNTTDKDVKIYLSTGMTDILPKPFSKSGLLEILQRYCSHLAVGQGLAAAAAGGLSEGVSAAALGLGLGLGFDPLLGSGLTLNSFLALPSSGAESDANSTVGDSGGSAAAAGIEERTRKRVTSSGSFTSLLKSLEGGQSSLSATGTSSTSSAKIQELSDADLMAIQMQADEDHGLSSNDHVGTPKTKTTTSIATTARKRSEESLGRDHGGFVSIPSPSLKKQKTLYSEVGGVPVISVQAPSTTSLASTSSAPGLQSTVVSAVGRMASIDDVDSASLHPVRSNLSTPRQSGGAGRAHGGSSTRRRAGGGRHRVTRQSPSPSVDLSETEF